MHRNLIFLHYPHILLEAVSTSRALENWIYIWKCPQKSKAWMKYDQKNLSGGPYQYSTSLKLPTDIFDPM